MREWSKSLIAVSIILGSLIIGFSIRAGLVRQQIIKTAQEKQEYIGRRKLECYNIFQKEREQEKEQTFTVASVEYFEPSNNPLEGKNYNDSCRIKYNYVIMNSDGSLRTESEYQSF